ncbi:unnamed protein product [Soboliphyme baturini]|uniref:Uncharacterized protein n=1 Tax=Soboliphyme baturini TaxID=241478 RepID=A0A183IEL9_9BILA|nr:unnamed protein product [Soboliphyme baturini]
MSTSLEGLIGTVVGDFTLAIFLVMAAIVVSVAILVIEKGNCRSRITTHLINCAIDEFLYKFISAHCLRRRRHRGRIRRPLLVVLASSSSSSSLLCPADQQKSIPIRLHPSEPGPVHPFSQGRRPGHESQAGHDSLPPPAYNDVSSSPPAAIPLAKAKAAAGETENTRYLLELLKYRSAVVIPEYCGGELCRRSSVDHPVPSPDCCVGNGDGRSSFGRDSRGAAWPIKTL